jgi:predicted transcriptional regulator
VGTMNLRFYLDDQTARELHRRAKRLGETRSWLIRKALREWLDMKTLSSPGWPTLIPAAGYSRHAAI